MEAVRHTKIEDEVLGERLACMVEGKTPDETEQDIIDEVEIRKKAQQILDSSQPCDTYKLEQLPKLIADYCSEICASTEAEPIMVVQAVLGTVSALVQKKICIHEPHYFQTLYPNLWMASITGSGHFKSTALRKGARLAYEREKDIQEQIEAGEQDGLSGKELKNLIETVRERSALLPTRCSPEALLEHLANNHGGMILVTELGEWLENLAKLHNSGLKALFTDLYDVPPQYGYSTKAGGYLIIREPFITINGVSTLTWVQNNIDPTDVGSGFFARFLLFYPPQNDNIPAALPGELLSRDYHPLDEVRDVISNLHDIKFHLSLGARSYFETAHRELYAIVRKENEVVQEILNPYLKRWSPYILKLAMLMQIFLDPNTNSISKDAVDAAKSIVDYAIKSTTYLFQNQLGESEFQLKERKILDYIAKCKGRVKRHQLQASRVLGGGSQEYEEVLESLIDSNKIKVTNKDQEKKNWVYVLIT
jgi:hypothetical protein